MNKLLSTLYAAFGLVKQELNPLDVFNRMEREGNNLGHKPTPGHGYGMTGCYTHPNKEQSKAARKMSARSRRINRGGSKDK